MLSHRSVGLLLWSAALLLPQTATAGCKRKSGHDKAQSGATSYVYEQCGGINWKGSTTCEAGSKCVVQNDYYSQCLPDASSSSASGACALRYAQCGGKGWQGPTCCNPGNTCTAFGEWYSQCLPARGSTSPKPLGPSPAPPPPPSPKSPSPSKDDYPSVPAPPMSEPYPSPLHPPSSPSPSPSKDDYPSLPSPPLSDSYPSPLPPSPPSKPQPKPPVVGPAPAPTPAVTSPNKPALSSNGTSVSSSGGFNPCKFNFGTSYDGEKDYYEGLDYLTVWAGAPNSETGSTDFNPYFHGKMLETAMKYKLTPVYYGYIIAFSGRAKAGLRDCDTGGLTLCEGGADFIRKNRDLILKTYAQYAKETAKIIGKNAMMIWLLEPDYYQYSDNKHETYVQRGGGLKKQEMTALLDDIIAAIKKELPNAKTSWDISPWVNGAQQEAWWSNFKSSDLDFIHTSGGRTQASMKRIRSDNNNLIEWGWMTRLTGKKLIADTGYGSGGGSTGHDEAWDKVENLKARIADGVIGITQAKPKPGWNKVVAQLRKQLPANICSAPPADDGYRRHLR